MGETRSQGQYPKQILVGEYDAARGKRKEISKKYYGSDTSISAGYSLIGRGRKRVKTQLKGSVTDDSFDTLLLKVEEVSSKMNGPNDAGQSSKHRSKHNSKQSSKQSKSRDDSRSMNSRSTYSGRSSGKSSGRSSARSMESMDGHTELLESLVHAAHAEDKLHREKENLQKQLQQLQKRNDELEQELLYTLKVVDKLRTKYKYASRSNQDMARKFHSEKAKWEKLQATLKQEQIALNKNKAASVQKL